MVVSPIARVVRKNLSEGGGESKIICTQIINLKIICWSEAFAHDFQGQRKSVGI